MSCEREFVVYRHDFRSKVWARCANVRERRQKSADLWRERVRGKERESVFLVSLSPDGAASGECGAKRSRDAHTTARAARAHRKVWTSTCGKHGQMPRARPKTAGRRCLTWGRRGCGLELEWRRAAMESPAGSLVFKVSRNRENAGCTLDFEASSGHKTSPRCLGFEGAERP